MEVIKRQWIILPIEVKVREFQSRTLLAYFALKAGYGVILGSQSSLNKALPDLPQGLYFDKSISKNKFEEIQYRVKMGYLYTSLDEEGLGYHKNPNYYAKNRYSEKTLKLTTKNFTWGEGEAKAIIDEYPHYKNQIIVTGNPRIDLWKSKFRAIYEIEKKQIIKEYGKFIIIPSNFSGYINASGVDFLINQAKLYGTIKTPEEEKLFLERLNHKQNILKAYIEAIKELSQKITNYKIIVRPHPSDDQEYWKKALSSLSNVKVIYKGNITPWLLAAEAVIHHGCTTGLESYLLNVPTITYLPFLDERFDKYFSRQVSYPTYYLDELIKTVIEISKNPKKGHSFYFPNNQESIQDFLSERIASCLEEEELATHKIIQSLQKLNWDPKELTDTPRQNKIKLNPYQSILNKIKNSQREKTRLNKKHVKQKNPGITLEEIEFLLDQYSLIENENNDICVNKMTDNLFALYK